MGEHLAITERITQAEARWPGLEFKRKTSGEASSTCPFCKQAVNDGFLIFANNGYLCRKCGVIGWIDDDQKRNALTPQEIEQIKQRAQYHKQTEREKRQAAIDLMASCEDHIRYHEQLKADSMECLWYQEGMTDALIDEYRLGICYKCPTKRDRSSLAIPVVNGGWLVNIRHRLITDGGDKYRPHRANLGNTLFGADDVYSDSESSILIVEGEKKRIIVKSQLGGRVVGTMGKSGFRRAWASRFTHIDEVLICLDPDALDKAREMATWFDDRARIVDVPVKSDDFFTRYHGTAEQFREFLKMARRIQ